MNTKLIMVEGIPGSGKSTIARKISEHLKYKNIKVNLYNECDIHPADLAWHAYIPINSFHSMINQYPEYSDIIKANMIIDCDYAIIPYTKLNIENDELFKYLESYEVYDGRTSLNTFCRLHHNRWSSFAEKAKNESVINIFECALLQNNVNELLLFNNARYELIHNHILCLLDKIKSLNPILIYLMQPCVSETITRVSQERISPNGGVAWIDHVIRYIEHSPYGIVNNLKGINGAIQYFADRKIIEQNILEETPINTIYINNQNYNWDEVWNCVLAELDNVM